MTRTKKTLSRAATVGAALALLAIEPGRPPLAPTDDGSAVSKPVPAVGGLRVAIDRDTGEKIPAPPLRLETLSSELRAALRRSSEGLIVIRRADGSKYVNLEGRFMSGIAVRVGQGSTSSYCTTEPHQAVAAPADTPSRHELR